jgi:hypothetical protein
LVQTSLAPQVSQAPSPAVTIGTPLTVMFTPPPKAPQCIRSSSAGHAPSEHGEHTVPQRPVGQRGWQVSPTHSSPLSQPQV